jgi:hypothetical protein
MSNFVFFPNYNIKLKRRETPKLKDENFDERLLLDLLLAMCFARLKRSCDLFL